MSDLESDPFNTGGASFGSILAASAAKLGHEVSLGPQAPTVTEDMYKPAKDEEVDANKELVAGNNPVARLLQGTGLTTLFPYSPPCQRRHATRLSASSTGRPKFRTACARAAAAAAQSGYSRS